MPDNSSQRSADDPEESGDESTGSFNPLALIDAAIEARQPETPWQPAGVVELEGELPDYRVLSLLGRGGMGAVYLVAARDSGQKYALKMLAPSLEEAEPGFAGRFRREARLLQRLSHPRIVALRNTGETSSGSFFYVMEWVDGEDLARMMRQTRISQGEAMAIIRQICEAVAFAHAHGVLHRDLKPSNILLSRQGAVKVADFGLAVAAGAMAGSRLTLTGMAMGTPEYAAPEQLRGEKATEASDIFSLGVIAYEMLTGEVPRGAFEPPSICRSTVDPGFDPVIMRALQPEPGKRQASVAAFLSDLAAAHDTALLTGSMEIIGSEQAQVLEKFYREAVQDIPLEVRRFVEDKLLTPSGYRDSRSMDEALKQQGVTREALERLVQQRLLRVENRRGVERVEITHDRLATAAQSSRDERRNAEDRERLAARERELRRSFQRKMILIVVGAGLIVTGILSWSRYQQVRQEAWAGTLARQHLSAMLEISTGPMADQMEQLGRLAIFDSQDQAVERALGEYRAATGESVSAIAEARYWDGRGKRLAARARPEEAFAAFVKARELWRGQNDFLAGVESGIRAAEQRLTQGRADALDQTLADTARLSSDAPAAARPVIEVMLRAMTTRGLALRNRLSEAIPSLEAAAKGVEALEASALPSDGLRLSLLRMRAAVLTTLLDTHRLRGEYEPAASAGLQSLDVIRQMRVREPSNFRHAILEADTLMLMARLAEDRGSAADMERYLGEQANLTETLRRQDPANVVWRGLHAASLGQRGRRKREAGQSAEGLELTQQAAREFSEIAALDPANENWQWDAVGYLLQTGDAFEVLNRHAEAEPFFRAGLERMLPFATSPEAPSANRFWGLTAAIRSVGECLRKQQRLADAQAHYESWIKRAEAGSGTPWRAIASTAAHNAAEIRLEQGDLAGAVAQHRAALAQWRLFFASAPGETRPSAGWAWRERPAAGCLSAAAMAIVASDPNVAAAGRGLAKEALDVFFSPAVGGQASYLPEDEAVRLKLLALPGVN